MPNKSPPKALNPPNNHKLWLIDGIGWFDDSQLVGYLMLLGKIGC